MSNLLGETLIILTIIIVPLVLILWSNRTNKKSGDIAAQSSEDELKSE